MISSLPDLKVLIELLLFMGANLWVAVQSYKDWQHYKQGVVTPYTGSEEFALRWNRKDEAMVHALKELFANKDHRARQERNSRWALEMSVFFLLLLAIGLVLYLVYFVL